MTDITIRFANVDDAERLLEIYTPYVEETAVSFEDEVPSLKEFGKRIAHTLVEYPYLVALIDGEISGYAYANQYRPHPAYKYAIETTIYVDQSKRRMGLGKALYQALENVLYEQNILNLNACIAYSDINDTQTLKNGSVKFHEKLGYNYVGEFKQIGFKFNHWYNIFWMEKLIGDHSEDPGPVKLLDDVRDIVNQKYGIK